MTRYVTVPRDAEVLIDIVGRLAQADPNDRLPLAYEWRDDAVQAGEGFMLPEPAALVWLAAYLEGGLRAPPARAAADPEAVAA